MYAQKGREPPRREPPSRRPPGASRPENPLWRRLAMRAPPSARAPVQGADARAEREADRTADALAAGDPARPAAPNSAVEPSGPRPVRDHLGPGSELPREVRDYFEPRLGIPLDAVRVHAGGSAAGSADALGVRAYTSGPDLVFGSGRYAPETAPGRWLLGHELAHAVQGGRGAGPPPLRAYEGPEHRYFGDEGVIHLRAYLGTEEGRTWARSIGMDPEVLRAQIDADPFAKTGNEQKKIRVGPGLDLTIGEVIALAGDFFAGPEALRRADKAEVKQILDVMKQQEKHEIGATEANVKFETITSGRYTSLAKDNAPHFARGKPLAGKDLTKGNRQAWQELHEAAMEHARTTLGEEELNRAYLMDAAAGHFLTDAFASGHMIDLRKVEPAIEGHLMLHPIDTRANPEMATIIAALGATGNTPKLVLKNIHDRLNRTGFAVTNARGMSWTTYGDDALEKAPETKTLASLAVFLSRRQVTRARAGEKPDSREVLDLLPDDASVERATNEAIRIIPEEAGNVMGLIHRNVGMLRATEVPVPILGPLLPLAGESLIKTISSPGRQKQLEWAQENKTVAPQFTIAEWDWP